MSVVHPARAKAVLSLAAADFKNAHRLSNRSTFMLLSCLCRLAMTEFASRHGLEDVSEITVEDLDRDLTGGTDSHGKDPARGRGVAPAA
jgi:hypothetical protein